ncbi:MAG TPA: DUF4870 domain-containing protein [Pyrinomonadaceae bacterium]|jgi:uncharacterized membrane protein
MQNPPPDPNYGSAYPPPPPPPPPGGPGAPGGKTSMGLEPNVAAMLCYATMFVCGLGIIVSLLFFLMEKTSRFVRFHAMQALLLAGAAIVLSIVLSIIGVILSYAHLGVIEYLLRLVCGLAFLVLWILGAIKAYQGETYKMPVVGDIAENITNK